MDDHGRLQRKVMRLERGGIVGVATLVTIPRMPPPPPGSIGRWRRRMRGGGRWRGYVAVHADVPSHDRLPMLVRLVVLSREVMVRFILGRSQQHAMVRIVVEPHARPGEARVVRKVKSIATGRAALSTRDHAVVHTVDGADWLGHALEGGGDELRWALEAAHEVRGREGEVGARRELRRGRERHGRRRGGLKVPEAE